MIKFIGIAVVFANFFFELWLDLRQFYRLKSQTKSGVPDVVQKYIAQHRKQAPKGEVNKEENDEIKLEETHKKTVNYNMDNMKLGFIADTIEFLQDVLMLYFNFMHVVYYFAAETLLKGWFGVQNPLEYEITTSIIVMIIMYLINQITTIPISLYHTFVLEEKYGFNKQTLRVWITDLIKSTVLSALIGLPIISMLIYLIKNYAGPHMHLYIWAALFAFSMFMMIIYPDYIATWFNDFKPLHEGELKTKIEELAASVNFPLKGIYVMDGSKRSAHSNAYLTGFLGLKRIVLYDTIEKQMSTEEIVAVLAHEIGHWKYSHIMKTITIEQVYQFIMWYMVGKFIYSPIAYTSMGFTDEKVRPVMVGLMTFMILYTPVSKLLGFARNWLSRYHEYQADKYAVVEHEKHELAPALVAIHRENLSDMDPDPLFSTMKYDHPTLIERLKALEHIKKE